MTIKDTLSIDKDPALKYLLDKDATGSVDKKFKQLLILGISLFIIGLIISSLIFMLLFNWLIPAVFNGPTVTYWQSMGLLLLSHIIGRFIK